MKVGSLFTGIGGFDLGFERAGFELAWCAEMDKAASGVLARHWPGVWNYGDVKAVMDGVPAVDVICGGFPCQDLSVAGRRAGLAGERSGLWFEFHRVLRELRPRWCVIENVPGLLSSNGGRDFAVILRGLVELGYRVSWRVLDAQYFGLAQRRRRVFIVGSLGDGRSAEVLFEREGVPGDPPARGEAGQGVAGSLGGSSQSGGFRTTDLDNSGAFIISRRGRAGGVSDEIEEGLALRTGVGGSSTSQIVFDPNAASGLAENQRGELRTSAISAQLTSGGGKPGQGYGAVYVPAIVPNAMSSKWAKGAGGPSGDEIQNLVAPVVSEWIPASVETLAGGAHPGGLNGQEAETQTLVQHGGVRRLTPTECERLHGFPDGWTAGQADSHRYKQLGNAVAVPVAEWIARRIAAVER